MASGVCADGSAIARLACRRIFQPYTLMFFSQYLLPFPFIRKQIIREICPRNICFEICFRFASLSFYYGNKSSEKSIRKIFASRFASDLLPFLFIMKTNHPRNLSKKYLLRDLLPICFPFLFIKKLMFCVNRQVYSYLLYMNLVSTNIL